jgi:LPS-assembly lipoprotein
MSSPDRRGVLAWLAALPLAALPLAACTFTPALAPGGAAAGRLMGRVQVDDPGDRFGFVLVDRLEERLGRAEAPLWRLSYSISTATQGVGITPESAITRYNLSGTIAWSLHRAGPGGERVAGGTARSFVGYNATGSTVAGFAAEEDAQRRLMRLLADQIVTRLIAEAPRLP